MNMPGLAGLIRRRILVNFRADPVVVQAQLPSPFRPKLHNGQAIIGICLIRLEAIRPAGVNIGFGLSSENAAHRIAVEWEKDGLQYEGVFIPRRDTGSLLNAYAGGRLFPGQHNLARFEVQQPSMNSICLHMQSTDQSIEVRLSGKLTDAFPASSCFASVAEASAFFEKGALGYSVRHASHQLDGIILKTHHWHVELLQIQEAFSSYFADERIFPQGSVQFDHALIMRDIAHEWHAAKPLLAAWSS
jgi:hypothetical protein